MPTILVVDDEKNIRATLARGLRLEGHVAVEAGNGAEALERLERGDIDLVILDLEMPVLDGLGFLDALAEKKKPVVPVLVLTAHGTIERAVRAVRAGALDFIEKPPAMERILLAIDNALRIGRLEEENRHLAEAAGVGSELLGSSVAMRELAETIRRVAPTHAPVLIQGENGTGKELVARAIHAGSTRAKRPIVTVNCAAIPESLFESELFGHARGAFTGATEARRGKFQQADGGTLFLDEVGEIPPSLQPKMLRALESGEAERVGGRDVERVDVRLLAATNRKLDEEVRSGRFRQDLYYRLLVVPVHVPPLRERREDIPLLARHYLELASRQNRIRPKTLTEDAIARLTAHAWPGNVRELRNAMGRVAILVPGDTVRADALSFLQGAASSGEGSSAALPAGPLDLTEELLRHERAIVMQVLERNRWKMTRSAQELGLERSHLYKKLKALGIERPVED